MPRPSTPLLSPDRIRSVALAIIDRDGLDGLSMRKLAAELGVQAASLYGHVRTKDQLLNDIASAILSSVDVSGFAVDWREGLIRCARSYRAALSSHPNIVPFLAYGPAGREESLQRLDILHGALVDAGWSRREATMIAAGLMYIVFGAALSTVLQRLLRRPRRLLRPLPAPRPGPPAARCRSRTRPRQLRTGARGVRARALVSSRGCCEVEGDRARGR